MTAIPPHPNADAADACRAASHGGTTDRHAATAGREEFRARPCAGAGRVCPWRRDADLTLFSEEDMARLIRASGGDTTGGAHSLDDAARMMSAPRMACHRDQPDTAHPLRLCAGWLTVIGPDHAATRLSVLTGRLPAEAIEPDTSTWPALHASLAELLERRRAQLAELQRDTPQPDRPEAGPASAARPA